MLIEQLPDIPRVHTALTEWGACMVFVLILARQGSWVRTVFVSAAGLFALLSVQTIAGALPLGFWIAGMALAVGAMYVFLLSELDASPLATGYITARAFVLAELAASLEWQLRTFFFPADADTDAGPLLMLVGVCVGLFSIVIFAEARHFSRTERLEVGLREFTSAIAIALLTFSVSNLSFLGATTPFSGRLGPEVFYIRTLVDLCGYIALWAQQEQRNELELRAENAAISELLHTQHDQYLAARNNIDEVTRMYHDMRHHIEAIRAEAQSERAAHHLKELEQSVHGYGRSMMTGNHVLDAVLTAKSHYARGQGVEITCVADGKLLSQMSVMDICTLAGNALDNAIEGAAQVADPAMRQVTVSLFAQDDWIVFRVENPFAGDLRRTGETLLSSKADSGRHGYGLRNIRDAVHKYSGSLSLESAGQWFSLRVLLPADRNGPGGANGAAGAESP